MVFIIFNMKTILIQMIFIAHYKKLMGNKIY